MRLHTAAFVSALTLASSASWSDAQTLADVARKEEQRRQTIKEPSKTYTNKDLGSGSDVILPPPVVPPPASTTSTASTSDADAAAEKSKEPARDQAYWASRMKTLQTQLDRNQTFLAALETRVNSLNTDFVNRDDPAQRGVIESNRQKALAELASLKQQVDADKKAIADLEEEARRANVPPGWLR
jgi:hypothetical protein